MQQEDWECQESEEVEGHNPFVDWVEPELDERMAFLILAMKAILGYTALAWPTSRNLCAGGMLLKDLRIGFCLCGADELQHTDWNLQSYVPTITV